VDAIPTNGLVKSSDVNPTPLSIERDAADSDHQLIPLNIF